MSTEGYPSFFYAAQSSGLVDRTTLLDVLQTVREGSGCPERYRRAETETETLRETASIQGGVSEEDETETATDLDYRLADALIETGRLNAWQASQLLAGRTKFSLGDYRIIDSIGLGGYGYVFLGREERDARRDRAARTGTPIDYFEEERPVAIKVLPRSRSTPELVARFEHEIESQQHLSHPNLVRFITSGRDGNVNFMVHEYVDGGDLRHRMRGGVKFPCDIAAAIVLQVAEALQYLHKSGLVHRDIKPSNILLSSDGCAKLADMGLALRFDHRDIGRDTAAPDASAESGGDVSDEESAESAESQQRFEQRLERAGLRGKVAGTIDYIAPDQIRSPHDPSPAWDIYSLGCAFYQMLTGSVPFPRETARQKFLAHLHQPPLDPRIFNPSIPYDIASLVLNMLAKEPAWRIRSAEEIVARLTPWLPPESFFPQLAATGAGSLDDFDAFNDSTDDDAEKETAERVSVSKTDVPFAISTSQRDVLPPPLPGGVAQSIPVPSTAPPPVREPVWIDTHSTSSPPYPGASRSGWQRLGLLVLQNLVLPGALAGLILWIVWRQLFRP